MKQEPIKIRAIFPTGEMRRKYNIEAGRCIVWDRKGKSFVPVTLPRQSIGCKFEWLGRYYKVVDDERYPSSLFYARKYHDEGEDMEDGLHLRSTRQCLK